MLQKISRFSRILAAYSCTFVAQKKNTFFPAERGYELLLIKFHSAKNNLIC